MYLDGLMTFFSKICTNTAVLMSTVTSLETNKKSTKREDVNFQTAIKLQLAQKP
jgi:hypothetical protein